MNKDRDKRPRVNYSRTHRSTHDKSWVYLSDMGDGIVYVRHNDKTYIGPLESAPPQILSALTRFASDEA